MLNFGIIIQTLRMGVGYIPAKMYELFVNCVATLT